VTATSHLFARVSATPAVQSLARRLEPGGLLSCAGVSPAAQPFLASLLAELFPERTVVVVTDGVKTQESFHQDLETWQAVKSEIRSPKSGIAGPLRRPLFYPAWDVLPHEARLPHSDVVSERLETLVALAADPGGAMPPAHLIVTTVAALMQRTYAPADLRGRLRFLGRGDRVEPLDLVEWLEAQGYEPEAQVTQKGELALRGGIVDVFPPTSPWPVRLEFFGDELESLRQFDPLTQMSREPVESVILPPAGELAILKARHPKWQLSTDADPAPRQSATPPPVLATFLDYLLPGTILLLCEPEQLAARADEYAAQIPAGDTFHVAWPEFLAAAGERRLARLELSEEAAGPLSAPADDADSELGEVAVSTWPLTPALFPDGGGEGAPADLSFSSLEAFRPLPERPPEPAVAEAQRREFFAQLHRWQRQGYAVHVFCNNEGERQRFGEIWQEYGLSEDRPAAPAVASQPVAGRAVAVADAGLRIEIGTLARGFLCQAAKLVVVTDAEIFGRYKVQRSRRLKSPHALATRSALDIDFTDLEEGDLVVHLQHGIGRYLGLKVMPLGAGRGQPGGAAGAAAADAAGEECLVIEYAPADPGQQAPRLYVPVTEAHLVSKYIGAGKAHPPLNTLGGTRWARAKEHAERAVRDIAAELLAIQAARDSLAGHPFGPDTPWQREFESSFVFEETPDQMRAIVESKSDMERAKPMDRLICGDVGFGKTEVAIRAAFKAVLGGKQVAVLVPTTVLAQQHFNTFRERMADYPVRVELLSRFRTRREQQEVVTALAAGAVDIVIGTHRLVQNDIRFKDLGLVVIDEEQRFGVLHKEQFKRLRQLVDVLTLTATPIPRTLYLALTGARDMSTIETPPHDRLPIETIVTHYDERVIRDAIQRELNRGGQVYFLHNRVLTIPTVAARLQALLPNARISVGHGQMHADELEEVMTRFVNGQTDVLLSTTIIESGLDIPNANTIIIDRADRFGLSDLYQLRGRVGRYKHQAYAYLLLPRHARLLTDVRKRISAMKQYSTLGSGFKVAMRDLEIRGAGNLLGAEQSGHITAVGFDLYCQLLKQSVASLKGEKVTARVEAAVSLDFLALSPTEENEVRSPKSLPAPPRERARQAGEVRSPKAAAGIPLRYIAEARQRIEVYRKVAQATTKAELERIRGELRDRFGPLPGPLELLLQVADLRILASERGITLLEVREDKLMLTRHGDFVQFDGKFPRLSTKSVGVRLKEIKRLLLAL
jgi:transcription-repair coupling factor (superfamily II helicase)